ncbi:serine hydrolase [Halobaculum lipolyticum]|uniref:Serine hydrolase n=1 Tax=Halobaculum lipolyticum TaxID=3032001 RepID=A0ABD5WDA3_9EURY|nr:serine hydrolase [Halobaculum sp. DT31]
MNTEARSRAADLLRRTMRRDRLPGVGVCVVDRDGVVYADGFGSRDLAGNRPASADTLFGVGSVTKSVTALALAQLREAGMLDFDDPVSDHLDVDLGGGDDDPVRLRHLLSHTSGLPSLGTSEALIGRRLRRSTDTTPLASRADFRAHVAGAVDPDGGERVGAPGERFAYSNEGYVLLGDVVEATTGREYGAYVAEHVLDPLGLDRATFDDATFAMDDDHATLYLHEDGETVAASVPTRELSRPAGGLFASATDLGRYLRLFLNDGSLDGREVVSPASVATLTEGRIDTPSGPYGYGWRTREACGRALVGHSGSIAVSSAYAGFCPAEGLGVAVAANASPDYPLVRLGEAVFACALGEDPAEAVPFVERRRRFDRLTGEYAAYRGAKRAYVARDGGTLRLQLVGPLGGESLPLVASEDPYTFHTPTEAGEPVPVEFRVDDDAGGRSVSLADGSSAGGRGPSVDLLYDRWHLHKVADEGASRE